MGKTHPYEFVLIAARVHLFPSRTQKLSSLAPTILGGRLPGKIGNANTKKSQAKAWLFFYIQVMLVATVHRTVATPGQYVGLPGKIGNAIREAPNDDTTSLSVHYVIRLVMKCCVLLGIKRTEFCLACTKDTPSIAGGVL